MRGCRISDEWTFRGFRAVILENELIKITLIPEYGSKIYEFIDKKADRDFLWHNPRLPLRSPVYGSNIDNWWHGGIDIGIPTDFACKYEDEELPYMGELWSLPWNYEIVKRDFKEVSVHTWCYTIIAPLKVELWISLEDDKREIKLKYKVTNVGFNSYNFLFGIHPALDINPSCRLDIPAKKMMIEWDGPDFPLGEKGTEYIWPYAVDKTGKKIDMRIIPPPSSGRFHFHYAMEITDGWLALTDTKSKQGFGMVFPSDIFKAMMIWFGYGGWRNSYCVVVEPWTGYPACLSDAVATGNCSHLEPGEVLEAEAKAMIFEGFKSIERIDPNGNIFGEKQV
ncbi:MAG: DUF5107 domain-containing protein [Actinobacteria bacterium]|nr:DUF5107 domain-containing protein [Actinomycetota bacterium]